MCRIEKMINQELHNLINFTILYFIYFLEIIFNDIDCKTFNDINDKTKIYLFLFVVFYFSKNFVQLS